MQICGVHFHRDEPPFPTLRSISPGDPICLKLPGNFYGQQPTSTPLIGLSLNFPDLLYRQTLTVNNSSLEVEIVDVCSGELSPFPEEAVYWADGCVVVYDVTSRVSFTHATELLQMVHQLRNQMPVVMLGNKSDLEHLRQVRD